jgi:hypothetical protein
MVLGNDSVDERDVYTPPCVVRISDLKQGNGQHICESGSGDTLCCFASGNSANDFCSGNGNGVIGP